MYKWLACLIAIQKYLYSYHTTALLYYSQIQVQSSSHANTPVEQTSQSLIPKTFFSPIPTYILSVEGRVTNAVGMTFYTWDLKALTNFLPGQYCQESNDITRYRFSVDASGFSTYPYTVGENVVPGYVG